MKHVRSYQLGSKIVTQEDTPMPNSDSKTYIVNDQPTETTDALDFTPREAVETLADIIQTVNTLCSNF